MDDQTESRLRGFLNERKLKRRHGYGVCQLAQVRDLSVWVSKDGKWYSLKDATIDELLDSERSVCKTMLTGIFGLSEPQARDVVRRFWTEQGLEGVYTDGKGRYAMVVKLPDSGWDHHDTQLVGTAAAGLLLSGLAGFVGYQKGKKNTPAIHSIDNETPRLVTEDVLLDTETPILDAEYDVEAVQGLVPYHVRDVENFMQKQQQRGFNEDEFNEEIGRRKQALDGMHDEFQRVLEPIRANAELLSAELNTHKLESNLSESQLKGKFQEDVERRYMDRQQFDASLKSLQTFSDYIWTELRCLRTGKARRELLKLSDIAHKKLNAAARAADS